MKYGVLFFKETENIGDDIQSYVAKKYLPRIDYIVEREELSTFCSKDNEIVSLILNGWFVHDITAFPPSPVINALVVSAHFTNYFQKGRPLYFDDYAVDFFKKYQPIGLRDNLLKKEFDDLNIDCYLSGCLTSTIKPFDNVKKNDSIILVDVDEKIVNHISKLSNNVEVLTHVLDKQVNSQLSFEQRMDNVENLLKRYQEASLVITTRLHCALPCLALNVPVILVYDNNIDVKNRLGGFLKYLNYFNPDDILKIKDISDFYLPVKNDKSFKEMAKSLDKTCKMFITNCGKAKKLRNKDISYANIYKRNKRILELKIEQLQKAIDDCNHRYFVLEQKNNDMQMMLGEKEDDIKQKDEVLKQKEMVINDLNNHVKSLQADIIKLNGELNVYKTSRYYKLANKFYIIVRKIKLLFTK